MKIPVHTLSAFTKDDQGGNSAGVVLFHYQSTDQELQRIANKVGYSETAFLLQSDHADLKMRYFTPNQEVDLCGHAR